VITDGGEVTHGMRREQNGDAVVDDRPQQEVHDVLAGEWIERSDWLVEEQDLGSFGEAHREGDLSLLTPREIADASIERDQKLVEMSLRALVVPCRVELSSETQHLGDPESLVERALLIETADAAEAFRVGWRSSTHPDVARRRCRDAGKYADER
jgi:hypothetical protein